MCPVYQITNDFVVRKNDLPHWRLGGAIYEITMTTKHRMPLNEECRDIVFDTFKYWDSKRYALRVLVVMPDHVHCMLEPSRLNENNFIDLSKIMHTIRGYTGHKISRILQTGGSVWDRDFYNRIIRDAEEFEAKWNYMLTNPVRAGLCKSISDYPWLWWR